MVKHFFVVDYGIIYNFCMIEIECSYVEGYLQ